MLILHGAKIRPLLDFHKAENMCSWNNGL